MMFLEPSRIDPSSKSSRRESFFEKTSFYANSPSASFYTAWNAGHPVNTAGCAFIWKASVYWIARMRGR